MTASTGNINHVDKQLFPVRIGETRQTFSIQIAAIRMHDHNGFGVRNPEIVLVFITVPQVLDSRNGCLLGYVPCH